MFDDGITEPQQGLTNKEREEGRNFCRFMQTWVVQDDIDAEIQKLVGRTASVFAAYVVLYNPLARIFADVDAVSLRKLVHFTVSVGYMLGKNDIDMVIPYTTEEQAQQAERKAVQECDCPQCRARRAAKEN